MVKVIVMIMIIVIVIIIVVVIVVVIVVIVIYALVIDHAMETGNLVMETGCSLGFRPTEDINKTTATAATATATTAAATTTTTNDNNDDNNDNDTTSLGSARREDLLNVALWSEGANKAADFVWILSGLCLDVMDCMHFIWMLSGFCLHFMHGG